MRFALGLLTMVSLNAFAQTAPAAQHGFCQVLVAFRNVTNPEAMGTHISAVGGFPIAIDPAIKQFQVQSSFIGARFDDKKIYLQSEIKFDGKDDYTLNMRIVFNGTEIKRSEKPSKEVPDVSPRRLANTVIMNMDEVKATGLVSFSGEEMLKMGAMNTAPSDQYIFSGFADNCVVEDPKK